MGLMSSLVVDIVAVIMIGQLGCAYACNSVASARDVPWVTDFLIRDSYWKRKASIRGIIITEFGVPVTG